MANSKRGPGQPRIELSDEQRVQVEALAAYLTQEQIGDYFGFSRATFQEILKRDDDCRERYNMGRAKAIASVSQSLVGKARKGDFQSQRLFLETQAGWNQTVKNEHVSPDGTMTPKAGGAVAIYQLPDNGRDKPAAEKPAGPKPMRKKRQRRLAAEAEAAKTKTKPKTPAKRRAATTKKAK